MPPSSITWPPSAPGAQPGRDQPLPYLVNWRHGTGTPPPPFPVRRLEMAEVELGSYRIDDTDRIALEPWSSAFVDQQRLSLVVDENDHRRHLFAARTGCSNPSDTQTARCVYPLVGLRNAMTPPGNSRPGHREKLKASHDPEAIQSKSALTGSSRLGMIRTERLPSPEHRIRLRLHRQGHGLAGPA